MKKIIFFLNNPYIYLFFIFVLWFLVLGFSFFNEPFIWDDLHLVRKYSFNELLSVWFSSWDPDGYETPSYRPIAILFYHSLVSIFGENVQNHRLFIFLLLYLLSILITKLLKKLSFNNIEIFFILLLLIFSKIFTTLASWMTLSHLIFCYIFLILSLISYLNWLEKNKTVSLIFSFLFAIVSILTREEVYFIPPLIFLLGLFLTDFTKKNLIKISITSMFYFFLVVVHYYLRSIFTEGAPSLGFAYRSFLSHLLQSGMPLGWFSSSAKITFFQILWICSVAFSTLILLINIKKISILEKKQIIILFLIIFVTSSPSFVSSRAFGILIPTIFSLSLIIKIFFINKINSKKFLHNNVFSKITLSILVVLIFSGVLGGFLRSNEHLKSINQYSIYIVALDTSFIFDNKNKDMKIPEDRRIKKKLFLKSLGIDQYISIDKIKTKLLSQEISNKIYIPNFHPLSPNFKFLLHKI
ncbi:hypothetical protein [Candidatus Pelagibacter sp.]|uniref:hypothetical protein n=1 Tax=Candidatus Pelagibacter sp. TaxID=2024849 RepID=UPI003F8716A5